MNELQARHIVDAYDAYAAEPWKKQSQADLKVEADQMIAEMDRKIAELKERVREERSAKVDYKISARDLSNGLKEAIAATRHQKYKRCMAMAKYCDASMAYFGEFYDSASEQMVAHYYKWRSRWYELAEKFKEAK